MAHTDAERDHGFDAHPILSATLADLSRMRVDEKYPRNPIPAGAMTVLGLVSRFSVGIQMAREAFDRNGSPPLGFSIERKWTFPTVRRRRVSGGTSA